MERMLPPRTRSLVGAAALCALALVLTPPGRAEAQPGPGGPSPVTIHVVDQNGQELTGSVVRLVGTSSEWQTPADAMLDFGPQLFNIEPAFQGTMFAGGWARPTATNGLSRDEFVFVDGTPVLTIVWNTAQVALDIADQGNAAVPGAAWGFAGEGVFYAPGTVTAPITDESVYSTMQGASLGGWNFAARAAFDGQAIDLTRNETREVTDGMTSLSFEWRQSTCNMGVVDATGTPIRGATWTMFGHTFAAGDAITLPATDASLYPTLAGAFAAGIPASLFTNTADGTGAATFAVLADGSLAPAFAPVGGSNYGLRCGVSAFPPITTGTLDGTVLADGKPRPGVTVTLTDILGATRTAVSDAVGGFVFPNVEQGSAVVVIAVPAGLHAVNPASGQWNVNVAAEATTTVQFTMESDVAPPPVANTPETWNYWRKEVRAALRGKGAHSESFADMSGNFPQAIFDQFAHAPTDPVVVEGVTQVDPDGSGPTAPERLMLADMSGTLDKTGISSALEDARRELLVILLNVVSHRLSLNLVIDAQGTTLDQEIHRLAAMINDGLRTNDRRAANHGAWINSGRAGGRHNGARTHGMGESLAYGDLAGEEQTLMGDPARATAALTAMRSSGAGVRFTITLPAPGPATLDLYDVAGRHVARLWEGETPAGVTAVTWPRGSARPGVYFARLISADGVDNAKVVVAQ